MTPKTRILVLQRDDNKCQITGIDFGLHIHHKIPRMFGGTDELDNLITISDSIHRAVELGKLSKISRVALQKIGMSEQEFFDKIHKLGLDSNPHQKHNWYN